MKSLHDYTGLRRAAGKRMRRLARRGTNGKTMALAMREYERATSAWMNALVRFMYPAKRMANLELVRQRPLLGVCRPEPLRVPLGELTTIVVRR